MTPQGKRLVSGHQTDDEMGSRVGWNPSGLYKTSIVKSATGGMLDRDVHGIAEWRGELLRQPEQRSGSTGVMGPADNACQAG